MSNKEDFMTPKKKIKVSNPTHNQSSSSDLISGRSKCKIYRGVLSFKKREQLGCYSPVQYHRSETFYHIDGPANFKTFVPREYVSLDNINKAMFTPRYFLENIKEVGSLSQTGITSQFFLSQNGVDGGKSMFKFGPGNPNMAGLSATQLPYQVTSLDNTTKSLWAIPNAICEVECIGNLNIRNNGKYPVRVEIYEWTLKDDFKNTLTSTANELQLEAGIAQTLSFSENTWGGSVDNGANEGAFVGSTQSQTLLPWFNLKSLSKGTPLDRAFKFFDRKTNELAPGESTYISLRNFKTKFNLKNVVQRLRKISFNPDDADPLFSDSNLYSIAGLHKGYLIMTTGTLGHGLVGEITEVGHTPQKLDVEERFYYRWRCKGQRYVTMPTCMSTPGGPATNITEPFAPGLIT